MLSVDVEEAWLIKLSIFVAQNIIPYYISIYLCKGDAKCRCGDGWAEDSNGNCQFLYSQGMKILVIILIIL